MPTLATNKRARFDYDVLEEFEAGIKLSGGEVKSAKGGHVQLDRAHISLRGTDAYLVGAHISYYKPSGPQTDYDPERPRRLLLHKKELNRLLGKSKEGGLTIIPISLYTKGDLVKVSVALAKGKKKFEKRETIKNREVDREIRRAKLE
jgi:SsrA-binding protein